MKHDSDVVIVGGGLNGPALALALAQGGLSVTVVDAQPKGARGNEGFDGRGYALALASQKLLAALNVWPRVADNAQPILEIKVTDGDAERGPSPFVLEFDHAEIEEGPMGFMVEDRFLSRALADALDAESAITQLHGETVVAQEVTSAGVTVTLGSGKTLTAKLIAGCDGRKSGVAERAKIKRSGWDYGQTALVCAVGHEKPHNGIAHQFFMPGGPLAILPLPDNKCSIVWSEERARAEQIAALDDDAYMEALRPVFGDFLGDIHLTGARFTYPLNLTLANEFVAPRIALVGDAAHGVHPIAGQGLNLGMRDVGALAEVLINATRRGEEIGAIDVLERYQTWRRWDATTLALGMDGVNKIFSNDNPLLRGVRDLGLGLVNALPGARRRFIREAAGLNGELPKLMKGQPL
ncbi:UbiH/UbiF/VisC/COQ6 family ubiquinone biosynthesis hydroxylase [Actibacterium atlanticum]|uniref:UbiH/UbiF/VisC/COQ6 family ubiquinone biosynthesis hydroxylase n=2 Tax=Actibacterium atlanticum TaxID=1461693 RepID=A0A058ZLA9_9RHOB|nr:UbiH/UbiF/VisC/COQ6 family ubiquinone biosynthesis hydroxylase [Actibacterium atlanticum]